MLMNISAWGFFFEIGKENEKMIKTQVEYAVEGIITPQMKAIGNKEGLAPQLIMERVAEGRIVLPLNANRPCSVVGIGMGLTTKINASIGTSTDIADVDAEVGKGDCRRAGRGRHPDGTVGRRRSGSHPARGAGGGFSAGG